METPAIQKTNTELLFENYLKELVKSNPQACRGVEINTSGHYPAEAPLVYGILVSLISDPLIIHGRRLTEGKIYTDGVRIRPETLGAWTGEYDKTGRPVFLHDIVEAPAKRLCSSPDAWGKQINKHHGAVGTVFLSVSLTGSSGHGFRGYTLQSIKPYTTQQRKLLELPVGREFNNQSVDFYTARIQDCTVIGTTWDNPKLLGALYQHWLDNTERWRLSNASGVK